MVADRTRSAIAAGVLLGTFVGDALGARWEGHGAVAIPNARARLEESLAAPELRYTDDTQLTLALAEHLCDHPGVDPGALAATFLAHFEHWRGYARGMHGIVDAWREGVAPEAAATAVFPDGSFGNGAAMRVAPIGVLHRDPEALAAAARRQAALTHAHPVGMDAAVVQARAVAVAADAGRFGRAELVEVSAACATDEVAKRMAVAVEQVDRWHDDARPAPEQVAAAIGTDVVASESVAAALWVAAAATDVEEAVVLALSLGGDIDTIAAMACAVLGAAGTDAALPTQWLERLEDGPRGRRYALDLAQRLAGVEA